MKALANSISVRLLSRPQETRDPRMRDAMAGRQQQNGQELKGLRVQRDRDPLPSHVNRAQYTKFHTHQLHVILTTARRDRPYR
ncbi:hypothetical protein GCM10010387_23020 [Streptomyces inusitatus]|uniref:Uncharacterized protein n=1 Tax=Streptomyces inusitatus TaxID=68221 RepID=A0A918Q215_9ACTN|nr:hypothetical protein GCM10010387_23020 [Streptomyces inusitatus]